jgi:hypothetical protein
MKFHQAVTSRNAGSPSKHSILLLVCIGLTPFALLRTFGMVNTLEGERVEKKVWDELAVLVQKMAPETAPVWDA